MNIRPYEERDRERLHEITAGSFRDASIHGKIEALYGLLRGTNWAERKLRDIDEDIRVDAQGVLVAEVDGEVVGYITTTVDEDTGMGRIGVSWVNALPFIEEALSIPELEVTGIYSHFALADDTDEVSEVFTVEQLDRFNAVLGLLKTRGHQIPNAHIANTGALYQYEGTLFDMTRLGISLYGCQPADETNVPIELEPVMSLVSEVVFVKRVLAGTPVSYGCTWKAPKETTIATIPIGYGDGYPRALSNLGQVLIRGKRFLTLSYISSAVRWVLACLTSFRITSR